MSVVYLVISVSGYYNLGQSATYLMNVLSVRRPHPPPRSQTNLLHYAVNNTTKIARLGHVLGRIKH